VKQLTASYSSLPGTEAAKSGTSEAVKGNGAAKAKPSAVAERMRQRFGARDTSSKKKVPIRKVANITEQRVLKTGVQSFHKDFVSTQAINLVEFPMKADGTPKVRSTPLFERLFSGRQELKATMEAEVAAAQPDLRHLSMEQLLALRVETLDFQTESEKFNAHNNFLGTLDQVLFQRLASRCLERSSVPAPAEISQQALFAVGRILCLMLGAAQMLIGGCDVQEAEESRVKASVPSYWLVKLEEDKWQGSSFAIFNIKQLWLQVVTGELDLKGRIPDQELVAVVHDRSAGSGQTRMFNWQVALLNPCDPPAEIAAEIERRATAIAVGTGSGKKMLSEALQKFRTANDLDMPASVQQSEVNAQVVRAGFVNGSSPPAATSTPAESVGRSSDVSTANGVHPVVPATLPERLPHEAASQQLREEKNDAVKPLLEEKNAASQPSVKPLLGEKNDAPQPSVKPFLEEKTAASQPSGKQPAWTTVEPSEWFAKPSTPQMPPPKVDNREVKPLGTSAAGADNVGAISTHVADTGDRRSETSANKKALIPTVKNEPASCFGFCFSFLSKSK